MMVWLVPLLGLLVVFLVLSAFFSSAETALFFLNPIQVHRLRARTPVAADRITGLLAYPQQTLSTILIGNIMVNVAASGVGYIICDQLFPGRGEQVAIPAMFALLLIFGEVAPKRLAMRHPEYLAIRYAAALALAVRLATPLHRILARLTRPFDKYIPPRRSALTEDEFRSVVEVSSEEGILTEEEFNMVEGIIRLETIEASDVMTPRVDMVGIDLNDPPEKNHALIARTRFRYLAAFRDTPDHIEGFVAVKKYLLLSDPPDLAAAMVPPFFVPETAPLDTLLAQFQKEKRVVAIVTDEYGGTAGLITRGDILDEIVDSAADEFEAQERMIRPMGENRWLIKGEVSLEEVNYELDLKLADENVDRIAGWLVAQAEHIPLAGETVMAQGCRVTAQRVRRNRVTWVVLEKTAPPAGDARSREAAGGAATEAKPA